MVIAYQDIKERSVYWFLFPIVACASGYLFYATTFFDFFWTTTIINIGIIALMFLVLFAYTKLKLKTSIGKVFGLGDGLLFIGLCASFPTISFTIFFVFSLLFSLLLHFIFKNSMQDSSVPLAGYMSIFYLCIYVMNWVGLYPNIYSI